MKAYLKSLAYYLPKEVLSNEVISNKFPEWDVNKITSKLGIVERRISSSDETISEMAIKASENLFTEFNINRDEIDFVLLCTQSPDYFLPTTACIVQDKLGIPTKAGALDFNLGCSGYIYGLALAKGLISTGIATNVLLITSEAYTKYIHPEDKSNMSIFGDAATASLISTSGFGEIQNFELGTDGSGADNLIVRNGCSKKRFEESLDYYDQFGNIINDKNLYMNGGEIFNFTSNLIPNLIRNTLLKNKSTKEEINLFIFHQANKYLLNHLRKKIDINDELFYIDMEKFGNTVSSTIPIALYGAMKKGKLQGKVLLAGFGVGYSWGGAIINCDYPV